METSPVHLVGRYFDSPSMTFAHYEFTKGSSVHQHSHPQEEVWVVIEGEVKITVDGVVRVATWGGGRRAAERPALADGHDGR